MTDGTAASSAETPRQSAPSPPATATPAGVRAAQDRLRAHLPHTPMRPAPKLAALTGARAVWLKLDNQFYTGSFKERGALNALLTLTADQSAAGVVTASAGNHAQALAHHARGLGISAKVVMPLPTPLVKVDGCRALGAKVVLHGETFDEAAEKARDLAVKERRTLVHPFDDPAVIMGQGVALLEMIAAAPDIEVLPISLGGGGLISGCLLAAEALGDAKFGNDNGAAPEILGVEPTMYPSMARTMAGQEAPLGGDTIAEGVAVKKVGALTHKICAARLNPADMLDVSEAAIEEAVVQLATLEKVVAEGAGALGLAAMMERPDRFRDRVVAVHVCGGNIDVRLLGQVLARHLVRGRRRARLRVECPDRPGRLAQIANVMRDSGANVMDVIHDRMALDVPAKSTVVDFLIETDDAAVTAAVVERLKAAGFPLTRLVEGR